MLVGSFSKWALYVVIGAITTKCFWLLTDDCVIKEVSCAVSWKRESTFELRITSKYRDVRVRFMSVSSQRAVVPRSNSSRQTSKELMWVAHSSSNSHVPMSIAPNWEPLLHVFLAFYFLRKCSCQSVPHGVFVHWTPLPLIFLRPSKSESLVRYSNSNFGFLFLYPLGLLAQSVNRPVGAKKWLVFGPVRRNSRILRTPWFRETEPFIWWS